MKIPLIHGTYTFSIGVANKGYDIGSFKEYLLLVHDTGKINITSRKSSIVYDGIFNIQPTITVSTIFK